MFYFYYFRSVAWIDLTCRIDVLPSYTEDYAMIRKYLTNTYEASDSPYTLELENVFVINREGEEGRFGSHAHLDRQLLWHGSRLSNWVGIVSVCFHQCHKLPFIE